jgi:predicted nucleic acid-binding protein
MEQYLIDTNVICDYFSASFSPKATNFMDKIINAIPNLSIITEIELTCWKTKATTEQSIKDFIEDSVILNIGTNVIDQCVNLRKGKKIKTPDAIIAATALANSFTLITNNERDFAHIKGVQIINPYKL